MLKVSRLVRQWQGGNIKVGAHCRLTEEMRHRDRTCPSLRATCGKPRMLTEATMKLLQTYSCLSLGRSV